MSAEHQDLPNGATPANGQCHFRVWAPHAKEVYVAGSFNEFSKTASPLAHESNGYWSGSVKDAKPGDQYLYRIVTESGELMRMDPYCRIVTTSVGKSIIHDPSFDWGVSPFTPPLPNEMVIYEMHVGTFAQGPGKDSGTLDTAITRLRHLRDLGTNVVEVMPIMEFAGRHSWGYNPSLIFAIDEHYGSPASFRRFVKAAHEQGIAVILDVVYNHFGPTDLSLWQFDGWSENGKGGIYFYNDWRAETPWGDTRPDYGREEVRRYIRDNALYWLRDYHVDGLRWDSTLYVRNAHGRNDDPPGDLPDGWGLMQWLNQEIKALKPRAFTISEDLQNNPFLTKTAKDGGAGFDAQWDARFVHPVRQVLIGAEDAARNMEEVRDAILHRDNLNAFERVIYTESHDEVANGKARIPEEVAPGNASNWFAKKKSTLGAALVFTAPGIPMIFQGQEFLEDDWFRDQDPIDWAKKERFAGIFQLYRDLIRLRLNRDGFTRGLCGQEVSVFHINPEQKVLAFHRWDKGGPGDSVVVVLNFADRSHAGYEIGLPSEGLWKVRINSDAKTYDAEFGDLACDDAIAEPGEKDGLPFHGKVQIAPYSFLILSRER